MSRTRRSSSRSTRTSSYRPRLPREGGRPFHEQWERDGQVDREVGAGAGERGLLCFDVEEEYGGAGVADFRYNMVVSEEIGRVGASGLGFPVHTDIIVPYIIPLGTHGAEAALAAAPGQRRADLARSP